MADLCTLTCAEVVAFLEEAIEARDAYIGTNMYRFRAVDDTEWRLRLQPRGQRTDIKLYGPDGLILHSVSRIEEHFSALEDDAAVEEDADGLRASLTDNELERSKAALSIQIAWRIYTKATQMVRENDLMTQSTSQTQNIQDMQSEMDTIKSNIQTQQIQIEVLNKSLLEKQKAIDVMLRAHVQNLESTQSIRHAIGASRLKISATAGRLTTCMEELAWEDELMNVIDFSDHLEFTDEEALQVDQATPLSREYIDERVEAILQESPTPDNRALIPLARSIHVNPRHKYPIITHRLPQYMTARSVTLPNGTKLVLARTLNGISPEAEKIVLSRFSRGILKDLKGSMQADPYIAAFDLRLQDTCVGALILRKYAIRCFGIRSQAMYIDCISVAKTVEGKGIGSAVLDMLFDMVFVGNDAQNAIMPCYVFAQCVRDHFWELRAHNTHDARALTLQVYLMNPTLEHLYRDCMPRGFQVFNERKGQSPSHP